MIWFFLHVPYLVVLFQIVNDVFADSNRTGWSKTLWVLVLIFLPILDGLAYLISPWAVHSPQTGRQGRC
jgi:hypothetical protein